MKSLRLLNHRAYSATPGIRGLLASALACALLVYAGGAWASAGKVKHGTYSGTTSERLNVSFKVSANGKRITSFATEIAYNGDCGQGGGPGFKITVPSMAIGAHGTFSATTKGTLHASVTVKPIKVKIKGAIVGGNAHGTVIQPGNKCQAPHQGVDPYSETFTAKASG